MKNTIKAEIKIEDFISEEELCNMTEKEREISEKVFFMNKEKLQSLTDTLNIVNDNLQDLDIVLDILNEVKDNLQLK